MTINGRAIGNRKRKAIRGLGEQKHAMGAKGSIPWTGNSAKKWAEFLA
jgi:hypothetical protein